jgi:hypothetical protein
LKALAGQAGLALAFALLVGCSTAPVSRAPAPVGAASVPAFAFGVDTFSFRNDIRSRDPDKPGLYANYCFVLARAVRQFYNFARFEPTWSRLDPAAYLERVRQVAAHDVWQPALLPEERVVIPGYRNLHEFSEENEAVVKEGLGGRFWTWVHWTNWRIGLPVGAPHQEGVAEQVAAEISAGRLVQLLVTNWPIPELNHTVVAFGYERSPGGIDFRVYDPNNPEGGGMITYDRELGSFWATDLYDTRPGKIRAFVMYYSRLL